MPSPTFPLNLLPPGTMSNHSILTPDEKAEIQRVQGMQVRTAAADQTTKLLAGKAPSMERWLRVAVVIERYILGVEQLDVPNPAVGRPSVP